MDNSGHVQDDEEPYRSVRGKLEDKEYSIQKGKLIIEPAAFQDRYKQPSVDRAKLIDYNPALSQKEVINHQVQYVEGDKHTNTIEGFWSLLKKAFYGTHHHYTVEYTPLYVAERC